MTDMDITAWIDKHEDVDYVTALVCDLNGVFRGKRIPRHQARKISDGGLKLALSGLGLDVWGRDVAGSGMVLETGDTDGQCLPTGRGPYLAGWTDSPSALVPVSIYEDGGKPFLADPRQALAAISARYGDKGLTPVCATELEFYLYDLKCPAYSAPLSPVTGKRLDRTDVYSVAVIDEFSAFLDDLYRECRNMDIPADCAISEGGAGQFEINLYHVDDPLKAADDAVLFKHIVKAIARKHEMGATFMAKPYDDKAGSGLHVHFSVIDKDGKNIFDNGGEDGTDELRHAVGGLIKTMPENALVFGPHLNSYQRVRPGTFAPTRIAWGYENRTTAIRIPNGPSIARRIEHRVAGADANPYLVLSAILGAALVGMEDQTEPPAAIAGNAYADDSIQDLPNNWWTAIEAFEQGASRNRLFSDQMATMFVAAKKQEYEEGEVWILQSRPIASLDDHETLKKYTFPIHWEHPEDDQRFWNRTHFERQGARPLLPLDIDFIRLLESTRVETCLRMGADRNEDLRVINGQVYTSPASMPISTTELRIRRQAYRDLQKRLIRDGLTSWDHWGPEIESANARLALIDATGLDGPGLANFLEEAMAVLCRNNMLHPMIRFKPRQSYFTAFEAVSGLRGREAETQAYNLLEGEESPLTQLIDELYRLAEEARKIPAVSDWIRAATKPASVEGVDKLAGFPMTAEGAAGWFSLLQSFLYEFGDRNGHGYGSESLISTPTWRDQPILVIQLAAKYLGGQGESPKQQRERSRQEIEVKVAALCSKCPDPQIVGDFLDQLKIAKKSMPILEIHNHHIEQVGRGQLRRALLAAANWLQKVGVIIKTEDVFWLTFSEILTILRKPETEGLEEKIKVRAEEHRQWQRYSPPGFLGLPSATLPPRPPGTNALTPNPLVKAGQIRGVGASTGVVSGRARVIKTWESAPQIERGVILVAENAGPLWLPFFPILAGIVLETGSLGQHAASTAREYGVPAVMDVPDARRLIGDGDWITIDGERGIVELDPEELRSNSK